MRLQLGYKNPQRSIPRKITVSWSELHLVWKRLHLLVVTQKAITNNF